jgi:hypothetical protein
VSDAEGVGGILVGSDVALPPAGIRPDGLAGCAQTGAESASAAITVTPPKLHLDRCRL